MIKNWAGCVFVSVFVISCGTEGNPELGLTDDVCSDAPAMSYEIDDIERLPVTRYAPVERDGIATESRQIAWGRVADVALHSDGTAYVADAMQKQIFALDRRGGEVGTLGRAGQGPGEFEYPIVIDIVHDSVLVFDPKLWRVTSTDLDGAGASVVSPPADAQIGQVWEGAFSSNGRLYHLSYAGYQASLMEELNGRREGVVRGKAQLQYWDRSGSEWHVLLQVAGPQIFASLDDGSILDVPFAKKPLWALDDTNALWYADNSGYTLLRIDPGGHETCAGSIRVDAPTVTTEEAERYTSAADIEDPRERRQVRQARRSIPVPDTKPVLEAMVGGVGGKVWIRPAPQFSTQRDGVVEWHVWTFVDGVTERALLPDDVAPTAFSNDRVLGIKTDALGVPSLVLLQPSRGPLAR